MEWRGGVSDSINTLDSFIKCSLLSWLVVTQHHRSEATHLTDIFHDDILELGLGGFEEVGQELSLVLGSDCSNDRDTFIKEGLDSVAA
jgi:hypothetical protein